MQVFRAEALVEQTKDETPANESGYGTLQCNYTGTSGYCPGAGGNCYPYVVWSSQSTIDSYIWTPELIRGVFSELYNGRGLTETYALSVRCVLDLNLTFAGSHFLIITKLIPCRQAL